MTEKSIEDILRDLMDYCRCCAMNGDCLNCGQKTMNIEQAAQAIRDYYLGKIPKEIYGSGFDKKGFNQGYNEALRECILAQRS